ncbi:MAG: SGNH/GDSL hydrolase family protein [Candidatus Curtissbacteria bacterium]|nr:SGNH/GDSL hydrolase family protein [Candidatus Curtissbacteria bacterium]
MKGFAPILALLLPAIAITVGSYYLVKSEVPGLNNPNRTTGDAKTLVPSPSPFIFETYTSPKIAKKSQYSIVMVGDSMTHALGPNGGTFSEFINVLYKPHNIGVVIDNYARSMSILEIDKQLTEKTTYWDSTFEPLLSRNFDLILVESFGYNPLSQFGTEEGIKKQTEELNKLMETLITTKPNSAIVFVATIAPNKQNYAKKVIVDIPIEARVKQAEERMAYIENHIAYAKSHNIPVVNIYEKSKNEQGDGDLKYINPNDYIHPSFEGVDFIGHEIANFIYENQILPR